MTETSPLIRQFVWEFLDRTRGRMAASEGAEIALLVLVWLKASEDDSLPPELRISTMLAQSPGAGLDALTKLLRSGIDGFRSLRIESTVSRLDAKDLFPVIELGLRLQNTGIVKQLSAEDTITAISALMSPERTFLPTQVAEFIVKLGQISKTDSVYVGWDQGQIAILAASISKHVHLETPTFSDVPSLLSMLARQPFEVHDSDPIKAPSFLDSGKLHKFDVALAMPPFNVRYPAEVTERDWFQRFPEQTFSGSILCSRHLLAQSIRRAVIAMPNSLTFSSGAERLFRENLLTRGQIEAVINMPSGLLLNTSIPFSILVLDPRGGHERVKFVDANTDRFRKTESKTRNTLTNIGDLVNLAVSEAEDTGSGFVKTSEIIANEAILVGSRYLVPEDVKRVIDIGASERQEILGNLVETVRAMPKVKERGEVEVGEISASDLPAFGYISGPGRTVLIEPQMVSRSQHLFLRPLDILFIIKGSVGKIGLVPHDAPPPGPGGWIAGQSAIVLRVKNDLIDPRALVVQLRSARGKALLQHLVSGSTIPLIQLGQLMKLPILVSNREATARAAEAFDRETVLQKEIDRLRKQQSEVASSLWAL